MALGRRKRGSRQRDPFSHLSDERQAAEKGEPWYMGEDDGPELDIETGISSDLGREDLDDRD